VSAPRSSEPSLRPFRAGLWFGGFNGLTWMIALGTPMVLLAERLGASTALVGLASSFVFLLLPLQVLSTSALSRLGFKRQMLLGWSLRALFLLVPLGLCLAAPEPPAPWMAPLLVASVFGFCLFRAFGAAANIPWLAAILPLEARGRYFATEQTLMSLGGVATLLACAALLRGGATWRGFAGVYALSLCGSALAVTALSRLPDAPRPRATPVRRLPAQALRLCAEPGPFRLYLALTLLGSVVSSGMVAFPAFYLKAEAGLPSSHILALTACHYGGALAGSWGVRRLLDRTAIRRFFRAAQALAALVYAYWLAFLLGAEALAAALPVAYLVFGVSTALGNTAHFTYLPSLSSDEERPVAIAVFTALFGLLSGLAPILWGLVLEESGPAQRMDVAAFAAYFAVGIALAAALWVLFARLTDPRGQALSPPRPPG
jgi:Na+/melibiose symporter-like transporter